MSLPSSPVPLDFQMLFEAVPDLYLVADLSLTVVAVSNAYLNHMSVQRDEVVGHNLLDVYAQTVDAQDAVDHLQLSIKTVMQMGMPHTMPVQRHRSQSTENVNGEIVHRWQSVNSPIFGTDHQLVYIIHRLEPMPVREGDDLAPLRQEQLRRTEEVWRWLSTEPPHHPTTNPCDSASTQPQAPVDSPQLTSIILVGPDSSICQMVQHELGQHYAITWLDDVAIAQALVQQRQPSLILVSPTWVDLASAAFTAFSKLREAAIAAQIPLILLLSDPAQEQWLENYPALADDYLISPFSACELRTRVRVNAGLVQLRQQTAQREQQLQHQAVVAHHQVVNILEHITDAFVALDKNGRYAYLNQEAARLLGRSPNELVGLRWQDMFPALAEQQSPIAEHFERAMIEQQTIRFEAFSEMVDRWLDISLFPSSEGLAIYFRDISQRKQSEEALRQSEEKFRQLAEHIGAVFWMADPLTRQLLYVSPAYETIWGRDCDRLYHDPSEWFAAIHPDDQDWVEMTFLNHTQPTAYDREYRIVRTDGSIGWVRDRAFPVFDPAKQLRRIVGIVEDITTLKTSQAAIAQLNQELQHRVNELQTLFNVIPIGIAIADDPSCQIIRVNPALASLLDIPLSGNASINPPTDHPKPAFKVYRDGVELAAHELPQQYATAHKVELRDVEIDIVRADGQRLNLYSYAAPLLDHRGDSRGSVGVFLDMTERQRSENERRQIEVSLRQSEEHFRLALQAARMVAWTWDAQTDQVVRSETACEVLGIARERLSESSGAGWNLVHPDDLAHHQSRVQKAIDEQGNYTSEFRVVRPDNGKTIWVEDRGQVLFDDQGNLLGIKGTLFDSTARKQAEESLLLSESRYRTLANAVAQLLWVNDVDGKVQFFNQRWLSYTGLPDLQLNVGLWADIIHPDDLAPTAAHRAAAIQAGEAYEVECRLKRYDHTYHWHLARVVPLKDEQGNILYWFGTATDIDDIKRVGAEQRFLAEASSALATSLDYHVTLNRIAHLAAPFLADLCLFDVVNPDRTLQRVAWHHVNPDRQTWFNQVQHYTPTQEFEHHPIASVLLQGEAVFVPDVTDAWLQSIAISQEHHQFLQECQICSYLSVPLRVRNQQLGALTLCFTAESNRSYTHAHLVLAKELAYRAALALDNAHLYQQAQEANRIKDEFLTVLSHELRSPLNPILGWTRLLRSRTFSAAETDRALATIERNAKVQTQLIDDLLDIARILRGKLALTVVATDLSEVVEAAIETVRLAAEAKSIQILPHLAPVALVAGDAGRLQQVVWNLLTNAVKFTPSGGRVEVRVESFEISGSEERLLLSNQSHHSQHYPSSRIVQISVTDNGKGIAPEFLPYIFDYFRQADSSTTRQFGGLGLGLAIVRHLVELHGGTVVAKSQGEGKGATFIVRLPLLRDGNLENRDRTLSATPSLTALAGRQILVVDDEEDTRELVCAILQEVGATVRQAASAAEALAILKDTPFDLLVSDIGMPHIDGYMLMQQIRASSGSAQSMPAIALTAYAGEMNQTNALAAGFQRHLVKPVEPTHLVETIIELLNSTQAE